jgi:hypothetical protein
MSGMLKIWPVLSPNILFILPSTYFFREKFNKNLTSNIAGAGNIKLSGNSDVFRCEIAGSGNLEGFNLKANAIHVNKAGSGNVKIHAVSEIHAQIVGSGNVIYTGNPVIEKSKSIGSGLIRKKD